MKPSTLPGLPIVRDVPVAVRASEVTGSTDGLGVMEVRFSPFNTLYRIDSWWEGTYMERTVPGAFKKTFAERGPKGSNQAKTLFNHGGDFSIGDKLLGSVLSLTEETDSPLSLVDLWDTSYNRDLLPGLRAGAYGSSFMFQVLKEAWDEEPAKTDDNPDGLPIRTIQEVRHFEAGPVTWPANPTATSGMRCMSGTDAYYELLSRRNSPHVNELRSQLTALRSASPAGPTTGDPAGAASNDRNEPTSVTRTGRTAAQRRAALYSHLIK